MVDVFTAGLIVLFVFTAIFYIVMFSFTFYWHLRNVSFIILPVYWAFEFFTIGFLITALVSIAFYILPIIIKTVLI